jgi:hypothetical protein
MEIRGDEVSFVLSGVDGSLEQPFPLLMSPPDTSAHRPGERDLHEEEEDDAAEQGGGHFNEQAALVSGYGLVAQVGFEQNWSTVGAAEADVNFEQFVVCPLVAVFWVGQVA